MNRNEQKQKDSKKVNCLFICEDNGHIAFIPQYPEINETFSYLEIYEVSQ